MREYLIDRRWCEGVRCARDAKPNVYRGHGDRRWHWQCKAHGKNNRAPYRFALTTNAIFEETKLSLLLWFKVLYLMSTTRASTCRMKLSTTASEA
jgi:hypothetical protein